MLKTSREKLRSEIRLLLQVTMSEKIDLADQRLQKLVQEDNEKSPLEKRGVEGMISELKQQLPADKRDAWEVKDIANVFLSYLDPYYSRAKLTSAQKQEKSGDLAKELLARLEEITAEAGPYAAYNRRSLELGIIVGREQINLSTVTIKSLSELAKMYDTASATMGNRQKKKSSAGKKKPGGNGLSKK